MPGGDVGDREPPGLLGDRGVELDLVEHVAELLDQRLVGRRVVGVERLERVDQLERLLDEVRDQRGVGLLAVPRALLAQRAGELVEADVPGADGHAERRHVHARQVVGRDGPVELAPRRLGDRLVGRAEALQDDDRLVAGRLLGGQLDVRQHPVGVGVGDQQRRRSRRPRRWRTRGRRSARTADSTGSMPSRAQARSRNDIAGSTTQRTRSSARSVRTVRSSTSGEPGTA